MTTVDTLVGELQKDDYYLNQGSRWFSKCNNFQFLQNVDGWSWERTVHCRHEVTLLLPKNPEATLQSTAFKSRQDACDYLETFLGEKAEFDFSGFCKSREFYYFHKDFPFRIVPEFKQKGWNLLADGAFRVLNKSGKRMVFSTRKAALEYYFEKA